MEFNFGQPNSQLEPQHENSINVDFSNSDSPMQPMEAMREAVFLEAVMNPVVVDEESLRAPPARRNVRLSTDPQSVAARRRRERISHKLRVLQRMVPGGTNMDTASMLDEAGHFLNFLKRQVELLELAGSAQVYRPVMSDDFFPGAGQL